MFIVWPKWKCSPFDEGNRYLRELELRQVLYLTRLIYKPCCLISQISSAELPEKLEVQISWFRSGPQLMYFTPTKWYDIGLGCTVFQGHPYRVASVWTMYGVEALHVSSIPTGTEKKSHSSNCRFVRQRANVGSPTSILDRSLILTVSTRNQIPTSHRNDLG